MHTIIFGSAHVIVKKIKITSSILIVINHDNLSSSSSDTNSEILSTSLLISSSSASRIASINRDWLQVVTFPSWDSGVSFWIDAEPGVVTFSYEISEIWEDVLKLPKFLEAFRNFRIVQKNLLGGFRQRSCSLKSKMFISTFLASSTRPSLLDDPSGIQTQVSRVGRVKNQRLMPTKLWLPTHIVDCCCT